MWRPRHLFTLLLIPQLAWGQDFTIPSSWKNASITRSQDERAQIAFDALKKGQSRWDTGKGLFDLNVTAGLERQPLMYSCMARGDYLAGTQNFDFLNSGIQKQTGFTVIDMLYVPIYWGIAAVDLYRSYGNNPAILQIAKDRFNQVAIFQMSQADADFGTHPKKMQKFVSACDGKTVAGGVFWSDSSNALSLHTLPSGYYALLAAYLAEIEAQTGGSNNTYKETALLGAQFVLDHQITNQNLVGTSLSLSSQGCTVDNGTMTHMNGMVIELFTVMTDITGDTKWRDVALKIVQASTQSSAMVDGDGIIKEGDLNTDIDTKWHKGRFMRHLYSTLVRLPNNTALHDYVNAFVGVQYNALVTNATQGGSNLYSSNWHGPPATWFTVDGTLAALDLLSVGTKLPGTTTSSSQTTSPGGGNKKGDSLSKGAIAGIGVGAGIVALLAGLLVFLFVRLRAQRRLDTVSSVEKLSYSPTPFEGIRSFAPSAAASAPSSKTPPLASRLPREEILMSDPGPREKGATVLTWQNGTTVLQQQNRASSVPSAEAGPSTTPATAQDGPHRDVAGPSNQDLIQIVDGLLRDRGLGDRPPQYRAHEDE